MAIDTGSWISGRAGTGPCDPSCGGDAQPEIGLLVFDELTGASTAFTVRDRPVIVRVFHNLSDVTLTLQMVDGCGAGDEFTDVVLPTLAKQGSVPGQTVFFVPFTGRYRLMSDTLGEAVSPDELRVTVSETTIAVDWAALVLAQNVGVAAGGGHVITSAPAVSDNPEIPTTYYGSGQHLVRADGWVEIPSLGGIKVPYVAS
jgi:hypothetical protein